MSVPTAQSVAQFFDNLLGQIGRPDPTSVEGKIYPFFARCGVIKRRPPRHEYWEFIREMGSGLIPNIFTKQPIGQDVLTFVFPERHMGVAEQQAFMRAIFEHPESQDGTIQQVDVLTSAPIIISDFTRQMLLIIEFDDDDNYRGTCEPKEYSMLKAFE